MGCEAQIQVRNGIVGQIPDELAEEHFRFGVLARKPQHYRKVLSRGHKSRVAGECFPEVRCGFIELITLRISQRCLMRQFPVFGIGSICRQQLVEVCPRTNDNTDGEANEKTHKVRLRRRTTGTRRTTKPQPHPPRNSAQHTHQDYAC